MKLHKKIERYITAFFKLGRTEWTAKQAMRRSQELETRLNDLQGKVHDVPAVLSRHGQLLADHTQNHELFLAAQQESRAASLAPLFHTISDLTARLDRLMLQGALPATVQPAQAETLGDAPGLKAFQDQFHRKLQERQQGGRSLIKERLKHYLQDVEAAHIRTGGKKIMDLGCGQGDWVALLADRGFPVFGIDRNAALLSDGKAKGLDLRTEDVVEALSAQEDNSLSVLSAHHLFADLSFDQVSWITREAQRVLAPGGLFLVETARLPDPGGRVCVHRPPPQEMVLSLLFETAGFHPVEVRLLNANEKLAELTQEGGMNEELALLLFGPQDLAALGTKLGES